MRELRKCADCGVTHSNGDAHLCTRYSDAHPCETCGAPSTFVFIAAPGVGSGWQCKNGHYDGTCRELTLEEVI